jgi:hypothetical protein
MRQPLGSWAFDVEKENAAGFPAAFSNLVRAC